MRDRKTELIERLGTLEESRDIRERQITLRETTIPSIREEFAKKSDVEKGTSEIKEMIRGLSAEAKEGRREMSQKLSDDIQRVHQRIDNFHERVDYRINGVSK